MGMMKGNNMDKMREAGKIMEENYPEKASTTWIVNTPFIFKAVWAMIKGFIDEKRRR